MCPGLALTGCGAPGRHEPSAGKLTEAATSTNRQWTGVAVSRSGRVFVCYPRWESEYTNAVEEILPDGTRRPYPDQAWNEWLPGAAGDRHFVCVQSLFVDAKDRLWILDAASPKMAGVVPQSAKLVQINLLHNRIDRVHFFDATAAPPQSYLSDVRVDAERDFAYVSDSGLGALIMVSLAGGHAWRVLEDHPSVKAEPDVVPIVQSRPLKRAADGQPLRANVDGLALDHRGEWLYYQALTGRTLYRVRTEALRDPNATTKFISRAIENLGETVVTDGLEIDRHDNVYFTALEKNAVAYRTPDGQLKMLVGDPRIAWPDSLALSRDGQLYFTTSQIHRTRWFTPDGSMPSEPYRLFKLRIYAPGD